MNGDFLWWYNVRVCSVYDADTITVDVDLGWHVKATSEKIRLARINAYEVRGPERVKGIAGRDWLREQLEGQSVVINTFKDFKGKYGRMVADVYVGNRCLNDELVKLGHARYQEY